MSRTADLETPDEALALRSRVTADGAVEVSLDRVPVPHPGPDQVVVRVEAAPINPSDLGLAFAGADLGAATLAQDLDRPGVSAPLSPAAARRAAARADRPIAIGNEGAGTVVAAGSGEAAQALLGQVVGVRGGTYAQYSVADAAECLEVLPGTTPEQAAAWLINPMTVLGMVETMRAEGHSALVNTAAASTLGLMLNRLCLDEGIPLVCIVRRPEQVELLRDSGATQVCDSSSDSFADDLLAALRDTGATIAFDAIGGGSLASAILAGMEQVLSEDDPPDQYGMRTHKQLYVYGGLDTGPTELMRSYGMAWGVGGWLLWSFLERAGEDTVAAMRRRVAEGLTTTFASQFTDRIALRDALELDALAAYARPATGTKFLITPNP